MAQYWAVFNIYRTSVRRSKIYRPSSVRGTSIENIEHLSKDVEPPPDEHLSNIYWKSSKSLSNVYRISVSLSLCLWLFSGSFWILSDPPAWLRRESRRMIKERHGGVAAVNVATGTFPLNQMPNGFERLYNDQRSGSHKQSCTIRIGTLQQSGTAKMTGGKEKMPSRQGNPIPRPIACKLTMCH